VRRAYGLGLGRIGGRVAARNSEKKGRSLLQSPESRRPPAACHQASPPCRWSLVGLALVAGACRPGRPVAGSICSSVVSPAAPPPLGHRRPAVRSNPRRAMDAGVNQSRGGEDEKLLGVWAIERESCTDWAGQWASMHSSIGIKKISPLGLGGPRPGFALK
jgi:hypothetical protein